MNQEPQIVQIARALVDAADSWCDENWTYGFADGEFGPGFEVKHKDAIEMARNIIASYGPVLQEN